jgi:hypothetical protein
MFGPSFTACEDPCLLVQQLFLSNVSTPPATRICKTGCAFDHFKGECLGPRKSSEFQALEAYDMLHVFQL